jgi:hypothetical protein
VVGSTDRRSAPAPERTGSPGRTSSAEHKGLRREVGFIGNYWALSVSLTTQQIERLIGEVVIPEEEGIDR